MLATFEVCGSPHVRLILQKSKNDTCIMILASLVFNIADRVKPLLSKPFSCPRPSEAMEVATPAILGCLGNLEAGIESRLAFKGF